MAKQKQPPSKLLRAQEVADLLGVSRSTVSSGKGIATDLPRVTRGRRYTRWFESDVLALLDKLKEEAQAAKAQKTQPSKVIELKEWKLTRSEVKAVASRFRR